MSGHPTFYRSLDPNSDRYPHNNLQGSQPLSRIGEVVQNASVEASYYTIARAQADEAGNSEPSVDFADWATVLPGVVCVVPILQRHACSVLQGESAASVIACAYGFGSQDDYLFTFSGVARSKSIKDPSDGVGIDGAVNTPGPLFTLAKRGYAQVVNTSDEILMPGDRVAWTFGTPPSKATSGFPYVGAAQKKCGPRRIEVVKVPPGVFHPNVFARVLNCAQRFHSVDLLLDTNTM